MDASWSNTSVPALVRYTHDGRRWTTLGVDLVGGRLSLDPQTLPGDGHGRFEIVLADGGGIIIVEGSPAAADDAQPQAWIDGPATLPVGAPLLLYGGRRIAMMARSTILPGRSMAYR